MFIIGAVAALAILAPGTSSDTQRGVKARSSALADQFSPPLASPAPPTLNAVSSLILGYEAFDAHNAFVHRTTFTPRPGPDFGRPTGDTVWVARREEAASEGRQDVKVTSSLECAGLTHVLERISALDTGRFAVFGISSPPTGLGPQSRDGYTYRFFGPGYGADGSRIALSVQGSTGLFKALGDEADYQLRGCWRPE